MRKRYAIRVGNDYGSFIHRFDITSKAKAIEMVREMVYEAEFLQDTEILGVPKGGRGPQSPGFKPDTIEAAGFYVDVIYQSWWEINLLDCPLATWLVSYNPRVEPLRIVELCDPDEVRALFFERDLYSRQCVTATEHVVLVKFNIMDQMQRRFAKRDMTVSSWYLKRSRLISHAPK